MDNILPLRLKKGELYEIFLRDNSVFKSILVDFDIENRWIVVHNKEKRVNRYHLDVIKNIRDAL